MIMNLRAALVLVFLSSTALAEFQLSTGSYSSCALYEGEVRCWGRYYGVEPMHIDLGNFDPGELFGGYIGCAVSTDRKSMKCWGDNSKGTLGQGDNVNRNAWDAAAMGDNLQPINFDEMPNLDADYQIEDVLVSYRVVCVLFSQDSGSDVRCWGDNGAHNRQYLGRKTGDYPLDTDATVSAMADVRPVNLDYTSFTPVKLGGGHATQCAISAEGEVTCWGIHTPNTMASLIFGTDDDTTFTPNKVQCGEYHCCFSSEEGDLRCKGSYNADIADMSSSNIGEHFVVKDFHVSFRSTCALSTMGEVKCAGDNNYGQLGYDNKDSIGDEDSGSKLGDNLATVPIGDAFTASGVHFAKMGGNYADAFHRCIIDDTVGSPLIKCWGWNKHGQLGYGDTVDRGNGGYTDVNGQFVPLLMEDLPYLDVYADLGFTEPSLSWHGWGGRKLPECAGDCDNDSHCQSGLYCYHDAGVTMNGPPPGCTGTAFTPKADYCFKVPASTGELVWFSWYQTGGLNACQGDCNDDDDCSDGLQCYHNAGENDVTVPGCTGVPDEKEDYCYNPNWDQDKSAPDGFASGHSDDEPAEDMEPDHAASTDEETLNLNDFIMMMVGAAIGVMVVAAIVAFVVLMKRKRSGKKEETEMAKVVHVAEVSPASVDGVETV